MSFFAVAKNFLFGSPKIANDIFDKDTGHIAKAGAFLGKLVFTDQERAEADQNMASAVHKFVVDTLEENTERSMARREIALFVIKFYCLLVFTCGMTYPVDKEWSAMWFQLSTTWQIGTLVSGVAAFFFGVHVVRANKK